LPICTLGEPEYSLIFQIKVMLLLLMLFIGTLAPVCAFPCIDNGMDVASSTV